MKRLRAISLLLLSVALVAGCAVFKGKSDRRSASDAQLVQPKTVKYAGTPSDAVSMVYTTKRELALTFNGMADKAAMKRLLDQLDTYKIKATFFLPGMRVAEEPDIAKLILARGHEIESNTLNRLDMKKLPYEQIVNEIKLSRDVIQKKTGVKPVYVRTMLGDYTDNVRLAAAQQGMEAVIGASLFLHNWENETPLQKSNYIRKYINRGGIIALDTQENKIIAESVKLIAEGAKNVGYQFVRLDKLMRDGGKRRPLEQIPGWNAARINTNYAAATYNVMYNKQDDPKKEVVLSFDDWGTDYTITKLLDVLAAYKVKASFFLRADGVEKNPNLARAIAEGGHDVGNHTYSHPVITTITPAQIQQEIVKAHKIITEAIQQQPTMLFRPPTGVVDESTLKVVGATGYRNIANFDVDPVDFNRSRTSAQILQTVKEDTKNGSVVLLHMLDDTQTIQALPSIITTLRGQGYTFVRMSELMGLAPNGQQTS
ncbi:polysaccharide deacetylase family protein [Paenibacillus lycopersici]|uniref:Polysaccharide deacetylase family protein n=1 Tax=Paenibacillus lycopersici TaxID=2704462 RepID=A0A6C0FSE0_9BACL|nr:polysaccharide deacetylase family protein [Paenibacillus lycopersici]QHT58992.1 polysaccharide deacetylase family protein [Paenibacillus lycopersici]